MNRREFTGLVAAGVVFPVDLMKGLAAQRPSLAGLGDDPAYQYSLHPIYYLGSDGVYALWQPGIILGELGPPSSASSDCTVWKGYYEEKWASFPNVLEAIRQAPPRSLLIDSGFRKVFDACGDFWHLGEGLVWHHHEYGSWIPLVLGWEYAGALEKSGHLKKRKPFCSFDDFISKSGSVHVWKEGPGDREVIVHREIC